MPEMEDLNEQAKEISALAASTLVLTTTFTVEFLSGAYRTVQVLAAYSWGAFLVSALLYGLWIVYPKSTWNFERRWHWLQFLVRGQILAFGLGLILSTSSALVAARMHGPEDEEGSNREVSVAVRVEPEVIRVQPEVLRVEPATIKLEPPIPTGTGSGGEIRGSLWGVTLLPVGVLALVAGIVLSASAKFRRIGVGLSAIGLLATTLGAFKWKLTGLEIHLSSGDIVIKLPVKPGEPYPPQAQDFELRRVALVEDFVDAENTKVKDVNEITELKRAVHDQLSANLRGSKPLAWVIVGRVDKRNLRPVKARRYGSNQGLAMARAAWVRDVVLDGYEPFKKNRAITTIGGPELLDDTVTAGAMGRDRAVEIYALVSDNEAASKAPRSGKSLIAKTRD